MFTWQNNYVRLLYRRQIDRRGWRTRSTAVLMCGLIGWSGAASAEAILGFSLGATAYQATVQGRLQSIDEPPGDDQTETFAPTRFSPTEMGLSDELEQEYFVQFAPDVPLFPKVRLSLLEFDYSVYATMVRDIHFVDTVFSAGEVVDTSMTISLKDMQLVYPITQHWLYWDAGLNLKQMDIDIDMSPRVDETQTEETVIPVNVTESQSHILLATNYAIKVPETFIDFGGRIHYYNLDDEHISDVQHFLRVTFAGSGSEFVAEMGYRKQKTISTLDTAELDLEFGGPYLSASFAF